MSGKNRRHKTKDRVYLLGDAQEIAMRRRPPPRIPGENKRKRAQRLRRLAAQSTE